MQNFKGRLQIGLFPFDIANMRCFSEVFFYNYINESLVCDDSDEVVFFIPMTPMNHPDKHKKSGHIFRYVRSVRDSNKESNPTYKFLPIGLYWHKILV